MVIGGHTIFEAFCLGPSLVGGSKFIPSMKLHVSHPHTCILKRWGRYFIWINQARYESLKSSQEPSKDTPTKRPKGKYMVKEQDTLKR